MGRAPLKFCFGFLLCVLGALPALAQEYEEANSMAADIFYLIIYLGSLLLIGYVLYQLTVATLEFVAKLIAAVLGLLVATITWTLFIFSFAIWITATVPATIITVIIGLLGASLWPETRRQIRLLCAAMFKPSDHLPALLAIRRKDERAFRREPNVEKLLSLVSAYERIDALSDQLVADGKFENTGKTLKDYLEAVRLLSDGLDACELNVRFLAEPPEFRPPTPPHEFSEMSDWSPFNVLFQHPTKALKFLFIYPFRAVAWIVTSPFIFSFEASRIVLSVIPLEATEQNQKRIERMKKLLSKHRREIEQVIRDFDKFQSEQQSVFQQTKALRDELAGELESVRKMAEQYHNEASRIREYVDLVKTRSDAMSQNDPLADMKSLLQEIRRPANSRASNV